MTPSSRTALLSLLVTLSELTVPVTPFSPPSCPSYCGARHSSVVQSSSITVLNAMERLHDPSTNAFGSIEHVYSLRDIDVVTQKISDDEWTALGSVIAETMYETILDVGDEALRQRGWVERMSLTSKIAEEVSKTVEKALSKIRMHPSNAYDHLGPHPLPPELLSALQTLLRHELGRIVGLDDKSSFSYNGRDLSLLVLSSVSDAIEAYCGIANIDAPFFSLSNEMEHRIRDRRRELLVKHSKGYESVRDIERDIERTRKEWVREVLGNRAASSYEFGEITTKDGNEHSHDKERRARDGRRSKILNALFQDLDGVLMP